VGRFLSIVGNKFSDESRGALCAPVIPKQKNLKETNDKKAGEHSLRIAQTIAPTEILYTHICSKVKAPVKADGNLSPDKLKAAASQFVA